MTQEDRSLLFRVGLVNQKRPDPPRSVRFEGDSVAWDEPSETNNVTGYNIRVGSDTSTVKYRVPVGTTGFTPSSADEELFVSSYNQTMKTESPLVAVTAGSGTNWLARLLMQPAETPNGIIVAFTFSRVPGVVLLNGQWLFENLGYTRVGTVITLPYAPSAADDLRAL